MDSAAMIAGLVIGMVVGLILLKFVFGAKKEAHDLVEPVEPTRGATGRSASTEDLERIRELYRKGEKIQAIKEYRDMTHCGLKEAKDFCDLNFTQELWTPLQQNLTATANTMAEEDRETALDEVRARINAGQKIQAIKVYRKLTGVGLAEAKSAVEAMEAGHSVVPPSAPVHSPADQARGLEEIRALYRAGEKIQAIKRYREVFGVGLAEAKNAVERL